MEMMFEARFAASDLDFEYDRILFGSNNFHISRSFYLRTVLEAVQIFRRIKWSTGVHQIKFTRYSRLTVSDAKTLN